MTHDYKSKLKLLAGSTSSPPSGDTIDRMTDVYVDTFTQLQTQIIESLPPYAAKNIPTDTLCRLKLEYKLTSRSLCYVSAPHTQLIELHANPDNSSVQMMGMLDKFKQHHPLFADVNKERVKEETFSPYAYCLLPEIEFKRYRQRMIDSIEDRFGAGRIGLQHNNLESLKRPPSPAQVKQMTVESYVHLTSSSCRSSVWVSFENDNGLSLDAECRLFRSVIKRDTDGKIIRPSCSQSNPAIVYFTPKVANQLVKHDISDVGSLMPIGLLAIAHLSMVKKMLHT